MVNIKIASFFDVSEEHTISAQLEETFTKEAVICWYLSTKYTGYFFCSELNRKPVVSLYTRKIIKLFT